MIRVRVALGAAVVAAAITSSGCGGPGFVGRWQTDYRPFLSSAESMAAESSSWTLTIGADTSTQQTIVTRYNPMARTNPGCTATTNIIGVTWNQRPSEGPMSITFNAATVAQTDRTGCANPADNMTLTPLTNVTSPIAGDATWSVMGMALTLQWREGTVMRMATFLRMN